MTISSSMRTAPRPKLQPISFFSIGSSGSFGILRSSSRICGSIDILLRGLRRERRLDAGEENERDDKADPDDEAEQRQQIHGGKPSDAFGPQLSEVAHHADREK